MAHSTCMPRSHVRTYVEKWNFSLKKWIKRFRHIRDWVSLSYQILDLIWIHYSYKSGGNSKRCSDSDGYLAGNACRKNSNRIIKEKSNRILSKGPERQAFDEVPVVAIWLYNFRPTKLTKILWEILFDKKIVMATGWKSKAVEIPLENQPNNHCHFPTNSFLRKSFGIKISYYKISNLAEKCCIFTSNTILSSLLHRWAIWLFIHKVQIPKNRPYWFHHFLFILVNEFVRFLYYKFTVMGGTLGPRTPLRNGIDSYTLSTNHSLQLGECNLRERWNATWATHSKNVCSLSGE